MICVRGRGRVGVRAIRILGLGLRRVRIAGGSAVYSAPSMSILPKTRALRGTCLFSSHDRLTVGTVLALSRVSEEMRA